MFFTKFALRKALVNLTKSDTVHFDQTASLAKAIANYLTDGGILKSEMAIKDQSDLIALQSSQLENIKKQLAEKRKELASLDEQAK